MTIGVNSWAAGVGVAADNKQFASQVEILARKHLLVGQYDVAKTAVVDHVPVRITSATHTADLFGVGSPLHRMAIGVDRGSFFGVETWAAPQPEDGAGAKAHSDVVFGGGPATESGSIVIYIMGEKVTIPVTNGDVVAVIGASAIAAINAMPELGVTASGAATVKIESNYKGTWGNYVSITMGWGDDEIPSGTAPITVTIPAMAGGATDPKIDDALTALGTGDSANTLGFTDVNFGWGLDDDDVMDAVSAYVGAGNTKTGLYSPTVGRPFRALYGDTVSTGVAATDLATLKAITDDQTYNRAMGLISAPDSPIHPCELACQVMGVIARMNSERAEAHALNVVLDGVQPGRRAYDWTTEYDNRDYAVQKGIGTTMEKGGVLTIQNVLTFYRPSSMPVASNGYRSMRNISIIQNMLNAIRVNFERDKWAGCSIVADTAKIGNALSRAKARSIGDVTDDLLALITGFGNRAWLYDAEWSKKKVAAGGLVSIRSGSNGFDCSLPVLLSGEAGIFNTVIEFDTSLAVLLG
jgi:phage tail sheath gpL-like